MPNPVTAELFTLRGQVALVTGAAGGLGREIASAFAQQGAAVIPSDINGYAGEVAAADLRAAGYQALAITADLGDAKSIGVLIKSALDWRGRIDTLACNAGIVGPTGPMLEVDEPSWRAVFEVNVRSAVLLTNALVPHMADRRAASLGCEVTKVSASTA